RFRAPPVSALRAPSRGLHRVRAESGPVAGGDPGATREAAAQSRARTRRLGKSVRKLDGAHRAADCGARTDEDEPQRVHRVRLTVAPTGAVGQPRRSRTDDVGGVALLA